MKSFRDRKARALRKALDVLPDRPAFAPGGEQRSCGGCHACCEVSPIHALEKPHHAPCPHQCVEGCDIYKSKPAECNHYQCSWLTGMLVGEENRPDKVGIVVDFRSPSPGAPGVIVCAWETRPDAALEPAAFELLRKLADFGAGCYLIPWNARVHDAATGVCEFVLLAKGPHDFKGRGVFDIHGDHLEILRHNMRRAQRG